MQITDHPDNQATNTSAPATPPPEPHPVLGLSPVEPCDQPVDGAALLDELASLLRAFVVLPARAAETLALWILHTYAFHLRDVTTYIGLESPEKRCGKTTLLTVLSELVNRPVVAANISSPAFFRVIEQLQPTLLIDEADAFLRRNDDLRGILNSGYSRKTAFVVRVAPVSPDSPPSSPAAAEIPHSASRSGRNAASCTLARFSSWCPKIIATIGHLPDTLVDRCILFRMERKLLGEKCQSLRTLDAAPLKRKCARFILDHQSAIAAARPELPNTLNDRAADIWEPLLALADLAGGRWPALARQAAQALAACPDDITPSAVLIFDIHLLFTGSGCDRLFSRSLVEALALHSDRPWLALTGGRKITELWLAQRLRPYGIRPRNIWLDGLQAKGYFQADFYNALKRYVSFSYVADYQARNPIAPKGEPRRSEIPAVTAHSKDSSQPHGAKCLK